MSSSGAPVRVIAHLDMDAFYASVELLRYPDLKGKPVVIGGGSRHQPQEITDPVTGQTRRQYALLRDYVGRGVITTATYEARAFGVNSALGLMKAAQRAPDAILLPTDFERYRQYSRLFKAAVREIAPTIEDRGIDEIYIDLTEVVAARLETRRDGDTADADDAAPGADDADRATAADLSPEDAAAEAWWCAREIAREIKQAVRTQTGLSCSIGLAPNKLIAKMASELDKPDGLEVITPQEVSTRIWPLSVRKIHGVGPKANARLEALGIQSIGDLAGKELPWLVEHFGRSYGTWLHEASHGRDERAVVTYSEPVSISRETTFDRDLHARRDRAELSEVFTELCVRLAGDLQRKHYVGRTIGVKLRFEDFRIVTRASTLAEATADPQVIRRTAGLCLKRVPLEKRIRLLGVRVGTLSRVGDTT